MSSYKDKLGWSPEKPGSINLDSKAAVETHKSSVFRKGDWNVAEPRLIQHSVTRSDFHIKPFSAGADELNSKMEQEGGRHDSEIETEQLPVDPKGIFIVLCLIVEYCEADFS